MKNHDFLARRSWRCRTSERWIGASALLLALQATLGAAAIAQTSGSESVDALYAGPPAQPCKRATCGAKDRPEEPLDLRLPTGEYIHEVVDLRVPGIGLDFEWRRTYRSQSSRSAPLGVGWDHSYNVYAELRANSVFVSDGGGRVLEFVADATGEFSCSNADYVARFDDAGAFVIAFPDQGHWIFAPMDGGSSAGKLLRIIDRNQNAIALHYDDRGRLGSILDSLANRYFLEYDAHGRVASLTDAYGRSVVYTYGLGSHEVSSGLPPTKGLDCDLLTVRAPLPGSRDDRPVEFDDYTTYYEYSRSTGVLELDHNLTRIEAPGRRLEKSIEYSATRDPASFMFDRVTAVVDEFGRTDITCEAPSQSAAGGSVTVIVNNQAGSVTECKFDQRGRRIEQRAYTGHAKPDAPTTREENRPTKSPRTTEQEFYITTWQWNDENRVTRTRKPSGLVVELTYESDLNPSAPRGQRGNLRRRALVRSDERGVSREVVGTEFFEYPLSFSGCCSGNFISSRTNLKGQIVESRLYDTRGNVVTMQARGGGDTEYFYDSLGRLIRIIHADNGSGHRREDAFSYYPQGSGSNSGRLHKETIDDTVLALVTTYEWDIHGKVARVTDPRGHDTSYVRDAAGTLTRVEFPTLYAANGDAYRVAYDLSWSPSTRVLQVDVDNYDEDGILQQNSKLTTWLTLDNYAHPTRIEQEVDGSRTIVETYSRNFRGEIDCVSWGEAVNGNDPFNKRQYYYDGLGRLFQRVDAPGSSTETTTQFDYDGNGNLTLVTRGFGSSSPTISEYHYDALDRLVLEVDAEGNEHHTRFDIDGNLEWEKVVGAAQSGSGAFERLFEANYTYDIQSRRVVDEVKHFDQNQNSIGDSLVVTKRIFSPFGQLISVTEDDQGVWDIAYDTANRLRVKSDPLGNQLAVTYDRSSNPENFELKEVVPGQSQVVTTTWLQSFDSLNRMISETDNLGSLRQFGHDSRGNVTHEIDRRGNVTARSFDGIGRLLAEAKQLTSNGLGSGQVVGQSTTQREWDDSSRCISEIDAMGNATRYAYDSNNRLIGVMASDGSISQVGQGMSWSLGSSRPNLQQFINGYDVLGNPLLETSASGTVVNTAYNALGLPISRNITPGPTTFPSTTSELFVYDGLSRLTAGANNSSVLVLRYDSTSMPLVENINGRVVGKVGDGIGGITQLTYPSGRTIDFELDARGRKDRILEGTSLIADYDYVGTYRPFRRVNGNGTIVSDAYDGGRRITETSHAAASGVAFDRRTYAWDEGDNKISEREHVTNSGTTHWGFDSLEQLVSTVSTSGSLSYGFDSSGNRTTVIGGPGSGNYTLDSTLPQPADAQVNQYTATPNAQFTWDDSGNPMTASQSGATRLRLYDYRNQLVADFDPATIYGGLYAYDVLGRRISKMTNGPGGLETVNISYDGWQVVEEQNVTTGAVRTYVNGHDIDEIVQVRTEEGDYYLHTDDKFSVTAITDANGAVVERYGYSDYGVVSYFDPAMSPRSSSIVGNDILFQGRQLDEESGLYYFRHRFFDPQSGRFLTRDPIGAWGDSVARGNAYTFLGNNPRSWTDPFGLQSPTPKQRVENTDTVFKFLYWTGGVICCIPPAGPILGGALLAITGLADLATPYPKYCTITVLSSGCDRIKELQKQAGGQPLEFCKLCDEAQPNCPFGTGFATTEMGTQQCVTIFQYSDHVCDKDCNKPIANVSGANNQETKLPPEALERLREMNRNAGGSGGGPAQGGSNQNPQPGSGK